MTDANPVPDPPLVVRVDADPPLVLPVSALPPAAPQPGFLQAVGWCGVFLIVLHGSTIVFAVGAWGVVALASGNAAAFLDEEMRWLTGAAASSREGGKVVFSPALSDALAWGTLLGPAFTLTALLLVVRAKLGRGWKRELGLRRPSANMLLLALIATPGLMILHGGVHELVHAVFRQPMTSELGETLKAMFSPWPWPFAVLAIGIIPGVQEELFCRGFLGRGLVGRYGVVAGVLLTSVLFGLLHVLPLYALGTMFMGVCLHFVYLTSRSLWVPIAVHTVNNSVTILATIGVIKLSSLEQDSTELGLFVYLAATVSVGCVFAAMWTGRVRFGSDVLAEPGPATPDAESRLVVASSEPLDRSRPNGYAVAGGVISAAVLLYLLLR